ncbi:unnamed protein product [Amoebophrya sp. A25]|nr:unnamed protein product [Amoebophrya sp. A25]|eukprot:GSA25T00012531001.1
MSGIAGAVGFAGRSKQQRVDVLLMRDPPATSSSSTKSSFSGSTSPASRTQSQSTASSSSSTSKKGEADKPGTTGKVDATKKKEEEGLEELETFLAQQIASHRLIARPVALCYALLALFCGAWGGFIGSRLGIGEKFAASLGQIPWFNRSSWGSESCVREDVVLRKLRSVIGSLANLSHQELLYMEDTLFPEEPDEPSGDDNVEADGRLVNPSRVQNAFTEDDDSGDALETRPPSAVSRVKTSSTSRKKARDPSGSSGARASSTQQVSKSQRGGRNRERAIAAERDFDMDGPTSVLQKSADKGVESFKTAATGKILDRISEIAPSIGRPREGGDE